MTQPSPARELDVAEAIARLCDGVLPINDAAASATFEAIGAILAQDVAATIDLPAFDNSAMDGYALRHADLAASSPLAEIGRSLAGHGFAGRVEAGTCVRIMTGAPVPDGADTVVVLEDTEMREGRVEVRAVPARGANIRLRGEHIARGSTVLHAGSRIDPAAAALATSVGADRLTVLRRLRVGVLSTGDELADPPTPLAPAGSYDANRPLLRAACARLGFEAHDLGICSDCGEAFAAVLDRALDAGCDVLLVSGGAAQGDADVVRQAGGVQFLPLNLRPGRGIAHARLSRGGQSLQLLGLPGNVVAAFLMFQLVARPVLLHLAGGRPEPLPRLRAPLAAPARVRGGRVDYRRARLDADGRVELLKDQGSAMLRTVVEADCLVALGPAERYDAGALVDVIPLGLLP